MTIDSTAARRDDAGSALLGSRTRAALQMYCESVSPLLDRIRELSDRISIVDEVRDATTRNAGIVARAAQAETERAMLEALDEHVAAWKRLRLLLSVSVIEDPIVQILSLQHMNAAEHLSDRLHELASFDGPTR